MKSKKLLNRTSGLDETDVKFREICNEIDKAVMGLKKLAAKQEPEIIAGVLLGYGNVLESIRYAISDEE